MLLRTLRRMACAAVVASALPVPVLAQAKPEKPVSPFLLCDGRTGHVGFMESLGRLVALTATAGLSEVVTATDDASRRTEGLASAKACETAIAQESDGRRRVELAMAQAIHLMEADRLDDALVVVRAMSATAGTFDADVGYRHTLRPRVQLLEADILMRQKKPEEAQNAAIVALDAAPYDVALTLRGLRYLTVVSTMDPAREATLRRAAKVLPQTALPVAAMFARADRYADAAALNGALTDLAGAFSTDFRPEGFDAERALYLALAGDAAASDAVAAKVRAGMKLLVASGWTTSHANVAADVNEGLLLRDVYRQAQSGQASEARATFRAHGEWLLVPDGTVATVVARLRDGAPASELTGTLAEPATALRAQKTEQAVAGLSTRDSLKSLYGLATQFAKMADYASASGRTWKIDGKRPRFVVAPDKDQIASTDILLTEPFVYGLQAGEALLLQAALIARSRGNDGFVMMPFRKSLTIAGIRTGKIGTPGIPALLALNADRVIVDIGARIPEPAQR